MLHRRGREWGGLGTQLFVPPSNLPIPPSSSLTCDHLFPCFIKDRERGRGNLEEKRSTYSDLAICKGRKLVHLCQLFGLALSIVVDWGFALAMLNEE